VVFWSGAAGSRRKRNEKVGDHFLSDLHFVFFSDPSSLLRREEEESTREREEKEKGLE